jgi:hypothetical protein
MYYIGVCVFSSMLYSLMFHVAVLHVPYSLFVCVCVCVRVRACVRVCVCVRHTTVLLCRATPHEFMALLSDLIPVQLPHHA